MRAAILQYQAGGEAKDTLPLIETLSADAASDGAKIICLPECASFIAKNRTSLFEIAEDEQHSPTLEKLQEIARKNAVMLSVGSLLMRDRDAEKCVNRSYLIHADGMIAARYDKIHMFSADVGDGKSYREAENFQPGNQLVLCDTALGKIGLSICYDVRFSTLYRQLALQGAQIITIPAAFTQVTGKAHWHVLLRARAIETGCFILAAAQIGTHADGRKTYGHALIINPWGEVIADAGTTPHCFISADLDLDEVAKARKALPSLNHHKDDLSF